MVEKSKINSKIKEELAEETEAEEPINEAQTQKIELTEEATSNELMMPFQRENLSRYVWKLLIVKKIEIRDVIFNRTNEPGQVSYVDGNIIEDE
ncbi:MAG: hypothetical protein OWS74_03660 [Firmicutes bacterium]|nr:hypothetical protein [Bacillota bacterium]